MYSLKFDPKVDKIVVKWKKSNPILFKKLQKILKDIVQHPRTGIGHPEPLIGGKDIVYSRHISATDRIIYNSTMMRSSLWSYNWKDIMTINKSDHPNICYLDGDRLRASIHDATNDKVQEILQGISKSLDEAASGTTMPLDTIWDRL